MTSRSTVSCKWKDLFCQFPSPRRKTIYGLQLYYQTTWFKSLNFPQRRRRIDLLLCLMSVLTLHSAKWIAELTWSSPRRWPLALWWLVRTNTSSSTICGLKIHTKCSTGANRQSSLTKSTFLTQSEQSATISHLPLRKWPRVERTVLLS